LKLAQRRQNDNAAEPKAVIPCFLKGYEERIFDCGLIVNILKILERNSHATEKILKTPQHSILRIERANEPEKYPRIDVSRDIFSQQSELLRKFDLLPLFKSQPTFQKQPHASLDDMIQTYLLRPICSQYRILNSTAMSLIMNELEFMRHLRTIRHIIFGSFVDAFFRILTEAVNDVNARFLGGVTDIHHCIQTITLQHGQRIQPVNIHYLLKMFNHCLRKYIDRERSNNATIFPITTETLSFVLATTTQQNADKATATKKRVDLFDLVGLSYYLPTPLNFVIRDDTIEKYSKLFFFLLKLRRAQHTLAVLWTVLQNKSNSRQIDSVFHNLTLLRHEMQHFVSSLQNYVFSQVAEIAWNDFCNKVSQVQTLNELITLHDRYVQNAIHKSMLNEKAQRVMAAVETVFYLIQQLYSQTSDYAVFNRALLVDNDFRKSLDDIREQFKRSAKFFFNIVANLRSTTYQHSLNTLSTTLNFNGFYSNE
jgi:hypothetical protein